MRREWKVASRYRLRLDFLSMLGFLDRNVWIDLPGLYIADVGGEVNSNSLYRNHALSTLTCRFNECCD